MSTMNHLSACNMMDKCNNCCCPGSNNNDIVVADEVARETAKSQALKDNELERKRLICDLEKAGVTFPIAEYEMMAHRKLLAGYTNTDGETGYDDDGDAKRAKTKATTSTRSSTSACGSWRSWRPSCRPCGAIS